MIPPRLALIAGAAMLIVALGAYAKHTTEKLGEAKADNRTLKTALVEQGEAVSALQREAEHVSELLLQTQAERDALAQRKARVKTVVREVLINDPKAAECGNAAMPESVASVVREYTRDSHEGAETIAPAQLGTADIGT